MFSSEPKPKPTALEILNKELERVHGQLDDYPIAPDWLQDRLAYLHDVLVLLAKDERGLVNHGSDNV